MIEHDGNDVDSAVEEGGGVAIVHHLRQMELDRELEMSGAISLTPTELTQRVAVLAKQSDRQANYMQGLPTREEFDFLVDLVNRLPTTTQYEAALLDITRLQEIARIQQHTMHLLTTAVEAALRGKAA